MVRFETRRRSGDIAVPSGSGRLPGRNPTGIDADKYLVLLKSLGRQAILLYFVGVGQLADLGYAEQNGSWPGTTGNQVHHGAFTVTDIMITQTIDEPTTAVAASYSRPQPRGSLLDPLAVALLAAVVSNVAARRPSLVV